MGIGRRGFPQVRATMFSKRLLVLFEGLSCTWSHIVYFYTCPQCFSQVDVCFRLSK